MIDLLLVVVGAVGFVICVTILVVNIENSHSY